MAFTKNPEARAWKARWNAVSERQNRELRRLSMTRRLQDFRSLFALAASSRRDPLDEKETAEVRKRWALLRRRWHSGG